MLAADEEYFHALCSKVQRELGFNSFDYEKKHLKRRFAARMRALNIGSYKSYMDVLDRDRGEYVHLKNTLTVNVTEFFRNPETWSAIYKVVLPVIAGEERRVLRVWSAGCSDGKEPYSLAVLLREFLGEEAERLSVTIFASDIDDVELQKAREGFYAQREVAGLSKEYLKKYFVPENGGYRAGEELKRWIKFEHRDLISDPKHTSLDLILCRNVVIYFTKELKERLYMDFCAALNSGGYFVMGKTEVLLGEARNLLKVVDNRERIYRKL